MWFLNHLSSDRCLFDWLVHLQYWRHMNWICFFKLCHYESILKGHQKLTRTRIGQLWCWSTKGSQILTTINIYIAICSSFEPVFCQSNKVRISSDRQYVTCRWINVRSVWYLQGFLACWQTLLQHMYIHLKSKSYFLVTAEKK